MDDKFIDIKGGQLDPRLNRIMYIAGTSEILINWKDFQQQPNACGYELDYSVRVKKEMEILQNAIFIKKQSSKIMRIQQKDNVFVGNYTILIDTKIKDENNTIILGSMNFDLEILPKTVYGPSLDNSIESGFEVPLKGTMRLEVGSY